MRMQQLAGKAAVVTGGGSGIGRAIALALARAGAPVVVADIRPENAGAVAGEIAAAGGRGVGVVCDVSDRAAVARLKAEANAAFGPASLLVANAGATAFQRLTDMTDADVDWIVQANLMGVANCLRAFLPQMYAAREGHVVATASAAGLIPAFSSRLCVYTAAKAAIVGLMLNLRGEAAELGVGATVLVPGGVQSAMAERNALYRPDRFGGPGEGAVEMPERGADAPSIVYRPAEEVAEMVLEAIREDRPMVVTDPSQRAAFETGYAALVRRAFDDLDRFEAARAATS
jgi:NAD(P)-dependent dehydrogenase (short-subunit alcohol dehydrogenase family)